MTRMNLKKIIDQKKEVNYKSTKRDMLIFVSPLISASMFLGPNLMTWSSLYGGSLEMTLSWGYIIDVNFQN